MRIAADTGLRSPDSEICYSRARERRELPADDVVGGAAREGLSGPAPEDGPQPAVRDVLEAGVRRAAPQGSERGGREGRDAGVFRALPGEGSDRARRAGARAVQGLPARVPRALDR